MMPPLPIHHTTPSKLRFIIQSTDVLQQMRINVTAENSSQVIWYKERFLSDDEIIEHVVHNPSGTVCWSIHRPKRGWYIRLRHPSFPPQTFIPFLPVPSSSPYHVEGALSFNSRTNARTSSNHVSNTSVGSSRPSIVPHDAPGSGNGSRVSEHSYPPTSSTSLARLPSPKPDSASVDTGKPTSTQTPPKMSSPAPQAMQISQFILAPHSIPPQVPDSESFLSRALSVIKSHRPSHSRSFTLSLVPDSPHSPPPYSSQATVVARVDMEDAPRPPLTTILVHHDRTPVFAVGSFTGLLEIDAGKEHVLGLDRSFWIAVALTYLEFLEDRESYLAALSD